MDPRVVQKAEELRQLLLTTQAASTADPTTTVPVPHTLLHDILEAVLEIVASQLGKQGQT